MPNFIDLKDLSKDQLLDIISLSIKWKNQEHSKFMTDKHVVLIFEKPSLRTRISFRSWYKPAWWNDLSTQ